MRISKNKKGWVRIIEAFIAVLLIFSLLFFLYVKNVNRADISDEIYSLQKALLLEISNNEELRKEVLENNTEKIIIFLENKIPKSFNYTIRICSLDEICSMDFYKKEVFSSETVISSTIYQYEPKVIKIFMWKE
ncbi:MAG: hypothetical protein QW117_02145 [Candidatus Pacearchaeota archaeon]